MASTREPTHVGADLRHDDLGGPTSHARDRVREEPPVDMAEFIVMRKYRGRGIGTKAAAELFRHFPTRWKVRQQKSDPGATTFWRHAIVYPFTERTTAEEIIEEFESGP